MALERRQPHEELLGAARENISRAGAALKKHHAGLMQATEEHRARALGFMEGLLSQGGAKTLGSHQRGPGAMSQEGSKTLKPAHRRSARAHRNGLFLVQPAVAAEAPAVAVEVPAAGTNAPAGKAASAPPPPAASSPADDEAFHPTPLQLLTHPIALFHFIPKQAALFAAGAVAGATAKTLTAPLDRWKLLLQVKAVANPDAVVAVSKVNLLESFLAIGKEEGLLGYWKGNLPQVIRIIPYSAVQLFAYETYKKAFMGDKKELSVPARLAAGACAGMTSTFITYPLDVLRLRLAVESGSKQMGEVAFRILREEGALAFYKGLGPSLISIAPYIALNFCAFDLVKKSIPEEYRKTPQASLFTALCATTLATVMCYPLDTVRRQMQMRNSPFKSIVDAVPGIIKRDGIQGLYRGFIANALKNLPNSSIRLTTYDTVKQLIASSQAEYDRLIEENKAAQGAKVAAPAT